MSSSTFGILAATMLLSVALATTMMLTTPAPVEDLAYDALGHDARQALNWFARAPQAPWESAPATATEYGLLSSARDRALDEDRVAALSAAPYARVREAMDSPRGFHLQVEPILPPMQDPTWTPLGLEGVAYLGRQEPASPALASITSAVATNSRGVNVSATVRNVGADPALFSVEMGLGNALQDVLKLSQTRSTRLLAPGESQLVWAEFPPQTSWGAVFTGARVGITDAAGAAAIASNGVPIARTWRSVTPPISLTGTYGHLLSPAQTYFEGPQPVAFVLDHYGPLGLHVTGASGRFTLHGPNGAEWVNSSVPLPAALGATYTYTCANCTAAGTYTARLYDPLLTRVQTTQVHLTLSPLPGTARLDPAAQREATQLDELVAGMDPALYHATLAPGGDVFLDKAEGARGITANLARYRTLVVGSNVSNSALASNGARTAMDGWVRGGGTLIVLGSSSGSIEWMNVMWGIALDHAPAPSSPTGTTPHALTAPESIDSSALKDWSRAWRLEDASKFRRIVAPANVPDRAEWAQSVDGTFGAGTLVLVAYTPGNATAGPDSLLDGKRLLHNVLVHAHTRFYASAGPPIPGGVPVAAADTILLGRDRLHPGGHPIRITLHAFDD